MNNGELELVDCFVPDDQLLAEGDALSKAGIYFRPGKIIQASKNLGVGQAALNKTAEFVQTYERGGRLLLKHQIEVFYLQLKAINDFPTYHDLPQNHHSQQQDLDQGSIQPYMCCLHIASYEYQMDQL